MTSVIGTESRPEPTDQSVLNQLELIGDDECSRCHDLESWRWVTDHCPHCQMSRRRWRQLVADPVTWSGH